jgi:3-isopropylmalate/(R)-2-methylmalate dehydratase small subunit
MHDLTTICGKAVALRIDNLDTDQIMPKQFLRGIDKSGLGSGVLYDHRFDTAGQPKPDFVLNRPANIGAPILLGGRNFGCGSSREHAVWGLQQFGIRTVVAPSFAEIFYSNAMGNRLLLVALPESATEVLMAAAESADPPLIEIDINAQEVRCQGLAPIGFELSTRHRQMFMEGLDSIGLSLGLKTDIDRFAAKHWEAQPWLRDVAARMRRQLDTPHRQK